MDGHEIAARGITPGRVGAVLALLLAFALVGGCIAGTAPGHRHGPEVLASVSAAPAFNATDVAWLQLMVPMDERVLPLLDLGAGRGHDPAVRRLAARIRRDHLTALVRLRATLGRTGLPAVNAHEGHDMPGMVTAAGLAELRAAAGPAFDRIFAGHLREHLDQSVLVARAEQVSGADRATTDLAADVEEARSAQRELLDAVQP
jgi:uncharacterized protein (DUF305 family)